MIYWEVFYIWIIVYLNKVVCECYLKYKIYFYIIKMNMYIVLFFLMENVYKCIFIIEIVISKEIVLFLVVSILDSKNIFWF